MYRPVHIKLSYYISLYPVTWNLLRFQDLNVISCGREYLGPGRLGGRCQIELAIDEDVVLDDVVEE